MTLHRHAGAASGASALAADEALPVVALVGRPNVGKSTFLARASGRFVETANAPGTTVVLERHRVVADGRAAWLVDLPGTRSLADAPAGDEPFWRLLVEVRPDAILVVVDAGNVERHLPLVLACRDLGLPIVVVANLADEAGARGVRLDAGRLSQLLAAPVHLTVGRTGQGIAAAVRDAVALAGQRRLVADGAASPRGTLPAPAYPPVVESELAGAAARFGAQSLGAAAWDPAGFGRLVADGRLAARGAASLELGARLDEHRWRVARAWASQVERLRSVPEPTAERLGRLATAPFPGIPAFVAVALGVFGLMVLVGGWLSAVLSTAWASLVSPVVSAAVLGAVPDPAVGRALLWAVDGGLLAMIAVGIPYVLTFYLLVAALEDSGYLTSAAVLMDRVFNVLGLPGRAAIPLLSAAGCNVPAIFGTRILRTRRERLLGAFLVVLTPCSARSAVVIAALAPFAGPPAALAAFGVVALIALGAGIAANAVVPGRQPSLVLELATLRRPLAGHVARKALARFRSFAVMATPIMLVGSLALGLVYETGLWTPVAAAAEPLTMGLLGLPAVAGLAIAFAFLRKELALQLLVALVAVAYGAGASLGAVLSPGQLFVFAIVTSISIPCAATLATLASEFGWRVAAVISGASLALALVAGAVVARLIAIA